MPYLKRMVCLANSFKNGGTCLAGKELLAGGYGNWIRPVSARATAEVLVSESRYGNDGSPKLLDIMDVPLSAPAPKHHQTENHLIDFTRRWVKVGELPWDGLPKLLDCEPSLWTNRYSSSTGVFNCLSQAEAAQQRHSLALIRPDDFSVEISGWTSKSKRTIRANFRYNNINYRLALTDPLVIGACALRDEGEYPMSDVFLCVSLTEPYAGDGRCHKLVAGVIAKTPF